MKIHRKALYPAVLLGAGIAMAFVLVLAKPRASTEIHEPPAPLVRVIPVASADVPMVVRTQGRVEPRAEIDLVAEVAGKVVEVAPTLAAGGFFEEGDLLVRIEPHDYALAVDRAKAEVARAEVRIAMEKAEANVAVREWKDIGEGGAAPALVAREPQLAEAAAGLSAARAMLAQATRDLERTAIRAPFAGRVREEDVDIGQFIARGEKIARIYSTDVAEIRLPLADDDLAFLDLNMAWRDSAKNAPGPEVTVHAEFAGHRWQWKGRIVRTEGQIDPATHVIHAVASVDDPYGRGSDPARPPLAAGLFVEADIEGRLASNVITLPRAAMRGESRVLVVDAEDRLRSRKVKVLRREGERVIVSDGLSAGERVCISTLEVATDGMKVRVAEEQDRSAVGSGSRRGRDAVGNTRRRSGTDPDFEESGSVPDLRDDAAALVEPVPAETGS
jgi:multidrug efflux system membrane fusion protein